MTFVYWRASYLLRQNLLFFRQNANNSIDNVQLYCSKPFAIGSVGATVTVVTTRCTIQLVYVIGAAVLHFNACDFAAAIRYRLAKADFSCDYTLGHCRMGTIQPAWKVSTTSFQQWTCGRHFFPCSSFETIPTFVVIITNFSGYLGVGCFSFCIGQFFVGFTNIN